MHAVPREVNGKWYPVPCPEGVSIGQSFPSYETCLAACETSDAYDSILDYERTRFELGADCEESYENGRADGYDVGWADGYAQGKELARSAEGA